MNLSTIVYLGGREDGHAYSINHLLRNMEDGNDPSWWAYYIQKAIFQEQEQGFVDPQDDTKGILARVDEILQKKMGMKEVFVGSINNQQAGLVPPLTLNNYIFREDCDVKKIWEWIRDHFLPLHTHDYDWFALLRFFADKNLLSQGMKTTNTNFAKQMQEWFPSYKFNPNAVKLYRTGYLGDTPYTKWDSKEFQKIIRANQTVDGFNHLNKICNTDLILALEDDSSILL